MKLVTILRWITRVVGTLITLFLIFMAVSYMVGPEESSPGPLMIVVICLFTFGIGLAWKWDGLGGMILLVGSILLFTAYPHIIWPPGLYHLMPLVTLLLLVCWMSERYVQKGIVEN